MKKIITATIASAIALSFPIALFAAGTTTEMSKPMPTTKKMDTPVTDTAMVKKSEKKTTVKKSEKKTTVKKSVKPVVKTTKSDAKVMKATTTKSH